MKCQSLFSGKQSNKKKIFQNYFNFIVYCEILLRMFIRLTS